MSYNGKEGGAISIETGSEMTANYRRNNPNEILGHFYGRDILKQILDQEGCMGIRMYYAEDADGKKELVLVGADSSEDDMLDLIADVSCQCPPCGTPNNLNS